MQLENAWFSRYPRPKVCVHDQGPEFMGDAFTTYLRNNGVKDKPVSVKNPTANAICERVHQTVGTILRTKMHLNPPQDLISLSDLIDSALATAMHATRVAANRSLDNLSAGQLVFHRDMLMNLPFIANLQLIQDKRQNLIDDNLRRANLDQVDFDYQPGQQVLVRVPDPAKLEARFIGPFPIEKVHCNGTVTIRRSEHILERLSIRRIKPYRQLA
jgi:transposase InsO family protein